MMAMRDTLFGDVPLEQWTQSVAGGHPEGPWKSFARAQELVLSGARDEAAELLSGITRTPGLESRLYLQAWTALRCLGTDPQGSDETRVYGVVLEVGLPEGLDLLACYADHTARYINHGGGGTIWEAPDASLDPEIDRLLNAGEVLAKIVGVWEGDRPPAPPTGQARLSVLTPAGIRFGQAPIDALMNDSLAGPVMSAGYALMMSLMRRSGQVPS